MSFFCLEAGRISSRSTGTPSDTRNRRLMRLLTQFGGARGGGATSCCHKERLRSDKKMEVWSDGSGGGAGLCSRVDGKIASR